MLGVVGLWICGVLVGWGFVRDGDHVVCLTRAGLFWFSLVLGDWDGLADVMVVAGFRGVCNAYVLSERSGSFGRGLVR